MVRLNKDVLERLCRKNDVEVLKIFGSGARGEDRPDSDVDLLAYFAEPKGLFDLVRIEREFSEALGRSVDLVTEGGLSPYLRDEILASAAVVYEHEG